MRGTKPNLRTDSDAIAVEMRPPKNLSAEARAEWKRVFPELVKRRILTAADLGTLENYCIATGIVREMEAVLQAEGRYYRGETGIKRHPATSIQAEAMTRARQLAAELGLTPVSRSRPAMNDANQDDDDNPLDLS